MSHESERRLILQMIESGKISASEGLNLLQALETAEDEIDASEDLDAASAGFSEKVLGAKSARDMGSADGTPSSETPVDFERLRGFWSYLLWVGVAITIIGGMLLYWAWQSNGISFWFACAWVPFLLGILVLGLAFQTRSSHWLHVRIKQAPGEHPGRIAFSLPLPFGLTAWFLRTFRGHIRGLDETVLDEIVQALHDTALQDSPIFIDVEDDEGGEHVQIYIG